MLYEWAGKYQIVCKPKLFNFVEERLSGNFIATAHEW